MRNYVRVTMYPRHQTHQKVIKPAVVMAEHFFDDTNKDDTASALFMALRDQQQLLDEGSQRNIGVPRVSVYRRPAGSEWADIEEIGDLSFKPRRTPWRRLSQLERERIVQLVREGRRREDVAKLYDVSAQYVHQLMFRAKRDEVAA